MKRQGMKLHRQRKRSLEKYDLKSISVTVVYFFVVNDGNGPSTDVKQSVDGDQL